MRSIKPLYARLATGHRAVGRIQLRVLLAGWCSWLSRIVNTDKVASSSLALVNLCFASVLSVLNMIWRIRGDEEDFHVAFSSSCSFFPYERELACCGAAGSPMRIV